MSSTLVGGEFQKQRLRGRHAIIASRYKYRFYRILEGCRRFRGDRRLRGSAGSAVKLAVNRMCRSTRFRDSVLRRTEGRLSALLPAQMRIQPAFGHELADALDPQVAGAQELILLEPMAAIGLMKLGDALPD